MADLASIVRAGISIANSATASLQVSVLHIPWIGNSEEGGPLPGTPVSLPALVEMKQALVRLPNGNEIMARAIVTFIGPIPANGAAGRKEPIDPRDTLVLPSGEECPILSVAGLIDAGTDAPFMLEVALG